MSAIPTSNSQSNISQSSISQSSISQSDVPDVLLIKGIVPPDSLRYNHSESDLQSSAKNEHSSIERKSSLRSHLSMNDIYKAAVESKVTQKDVVVIFGEMVKNLVNKEALNSNSPAILLPFCGTKEPKVSIEWYLWRIVYYLNKYPNVELTFFAEDEQTIPADLSSGKTIDVHKEGNAISRGLRSLLVALIYIDRVTEAHPNFKLSPLSVHRVFLTAILVAAKFLDDFPLGVNVFAKLGGISTKEMNNMELRFCSLIHFNLVVREIEFEQKGMRNLRYAFEIASFRVKMGKTMGTVPPPM